MILYSHCLRQGRVRTPAQGCSCTTASPQRRCLVCSRIPQTSSSDPAGGHPSRCVSRTCKRRSPPPCYPMQQRHPPNRSCSTRRSPQCCCTAVAEPPSAWRMCIPMLRPGAHTRVASRVSKFSSQIGLKNVRISGFCASHRRAPLRGKYRHPDTAEKNRYQKKQHVGEVPREVPIPANKVICTPSRDSAFFVLLSGQARVRQEYTLNPRVPNPQLNPEGTRLNPEF